MKIKEYDIEFVKQIPDKLKEGILYICLDCNVIIHLCACGCKMEVVTPIEKKQWQMCYNGEEITLTPSIGNFSFPCKSHYFIRNNKVEWAKTYMTDYRYRPRGQKRLFQKFMHIFRR